MTRERSFVDELKRRRVPRVALVYMASAFAVMQAADMIFPRIPLPEWTVSLVVWLALLGFPIALVLAWAFDVRGGSVQRTSGVNDVVPASDVVKSTSWLSARTLIIAGALVVLGVGMGAGWILRPVTSSDASDIALRSRVAVLPFRNASPGDSQSAMLALGVHDDLLSRLSRVRSLRVTSRTSVMEYAATVKNIRDIATELGVGVILEGGVQRAGNNVRINVQLIDATTDEHLWAETYNRDWSLDNLFAMQTDIAEQVARALEATLSPTERAAIATVPTKDTTAFRLYTQAADVLNSTNSAESQRAAGRLLTQAIARDSTFAAAWALLGSVHAAMYFQHWDRTPTRLQLADQATRHALALDSLLPDAHAARGQYYYHGFLDYEKALAEFERALQLDPSNVAALRWTAAARRRQGQVEESVRYYQRAHELDPRTVAFLAEVGFSQLLLRRYDDGVRTAEKVVALSPGDQDVLIMEGWSHYLGRGDLAAMRRSLERARRLGQLSSELESTIEYLERNFAAALERLRDDNRMFMVDDQFLLLPGDLLRADLHRHLGQTESAGALYRRAADQLTQYLAAHADDDRAWSSLGIAYAGLGRRDDAIRAGRKGVELVPIEREAWRGAHRLDDLARIHALLGNTDEAITILEDLMRRPAGIVVSPHTLRIDAGYDPLRGEPRFRALVR